MFQFTCPKIQNHQSLFNTQVIISGKPACNLQTDSVDIIEGQFSLFLLDADGQILFFVTVSCSIFLYNLYHFGSDMQTHPHKPYLDYLSTLFCQMEPLSEQERRWAFNRDRLHTPLQVSSSSCGLPLYW